MGLTTYSEVEDALARIAERVRARIIVDADTGFGNALNVQRTVRGLERAGAAMIQLEDQTFPKRCGHLDGKSVVPAAEMCGKLRAAVDARQSRETLILARTDALASEGWTPRWIGPSAIWKRARTPCSSRPCAAANRCGRPAGASPAARRCWPTWSRAARRRCKARRSWPRWDSASSSSGRHGARRITLAGYYGSLRQHGTTAPWRDRMLDFDGLNAMIGTPELLAAGKRYEA